MAETIDLSTINDIQQLKALAYDYISEIERDQQYLKAINQKIAEQMSVQPPKSEAATAAESAIEKESEPTEEPAADTSTE